MHVLWDFTNADILVKRKEDERWWQVQLKTGNKSSDSTAGHRKWWVDMKEGYPNMLVMFRTYDTAQDDKKSTDEYHYTWLYDGGLFGPKRFETNPTFSITLGKGNKWTDVDWQPKPENAEEVTKFNETVKLFTWWDRSKRHIAWLQAKDAPGAYDNAARAIVDFCTKAKEDKEEYYAQTTLEKAQWDFKSAKQFVERAALEFLQKVIAWTFHHIVTDPDEMALSRLHPVTGARYNACCSLGE